MQKNKEQRENDLTLECESAKSPTHFSSCRTSIIVSYYIFFVYNNYRPLATLKTNQTRKSR